MLIIGLLWGGWPELECLYCHRGAFSESLTLFLMGEKITEGKYWVKPWTALLGEKKFPGSTQDILHQ